MAELGGGCPGFQARGGAGEAQPRWQPPPQRSDPGGIPEKHSEEASAWGSRGPVAGPSLVWGEGGSAL